MDQHLTWTDTGCVQMGGRFIGHTELMKDGNRPFYPEAVICTHSAPTREEAIAGAEAKRVQHEHINGRN